MRDKGVIVPIDYRFAAVPYPVCKVEKHPTCLACVNHRGLFYPPQNVLQSSIIDSVIFLYLDPQSIQCAQSEIG